MPCSPSQCTGCKSSLALVSPLCSALKKPKARMSLGAKQNPKKTPRLYIVSQIIDHKITRGRSAFLVVWRDYPDENSWEPFGIVSRLDAFRLYCKKNNIIARTSSIRTVKPAPPLLYKDDEITEELPEEPEDLELPPIPVDDAVPYDSDDSVAKVRRLLLLLLLLLLF
jgi:hypothetical protein